jgi:hypothetical protein
MKYLTMIQRTSQKDEPYNGWKNQEGNRQLGKHKQVWGTLLNLDQETCNVKRNAGTELYNERF